MEGNMAGAQNKRNSPGAFRSCLIPYKDQIFTWWFDDRKSAREIQALLAEQFGLEVNWSTITRFIKVRSQKADPHERSVHLQQRNTAQELSYPSVSVKSSQESCGKQVLTDKRKNGNIIQMLRNTSAQELGRMADEALERKGK